MGAIDIAGQPLTVSQIARRMGLTRQGVQRIVNDLLFIDILEKKTNLDHKRAPLVTLTKKGNQVMAQINKAQASWVNELSDDSSERQINQALKLVQKLCERLEENKS